MEWHDQMYDMVLASICNYLLYAHFQTSACISQLSSTSPSFNPKILVTHTPSIFIHFISPASLVIFQT